MKMMTNKLELHNIAELDNLQHDLKDYLKLAATKGMPVHEVEKR